MSYISNFRRTKQGLEQEERKISELFYVGCTDDYYSLEQVIINIELFIRKRDVEIYVIEPFSELGYQPRLFAEGYEAFYKFIELTPKYIYDNIREISIYDKELDLTYWFEGYGLPMIEEAPWYTFWITQGKNELYRKD